MKGTVFRMLLRDGRERRTDKGLDDDTGWLLRCHDTAAVWYDYPPGHYRCRIRVVLAGR